MEKKSSERSLRRKHKVTVSFNEKEMKVIEHFVRKYKINNKSKFFRESIVIAILQKLEDDYPKLFD
jgi:hypothetical protein